MKYRAEIDGLRALAVIPVILYHAGFKLFGGGYVGVDVFFVISGYLITTIILAELESGTFSLIHFYERRARRILPALFVVMFVCLPFAWFWLLPNTMKQFSESLVAVSTFASNILFWRISGYFDTATELKPLIHTWSLAVEEQYYVLFPLFLMLTYKLGKRWIVRLLVLIFVISLAGAQSLSETHPSFNFYMLPTRGWELLIGAFIAFYYSRHNIKKHNHIIEQLGSLFGLLLIAYSVFSYNDKTPFPSVYALAPTLGAALIIIFASHKTVVGKLLGTKIFVAIGLVSYSAYLWHQPMFAFARERSFDKPSLYLMSALAVLSFTFAYLSWKYVERPFRNKNRISRNKVFSYGALCSALFIGIGLAGYLGDGFRSRFEATNVSATSISAGDSTLSSVSSGQVSTTSINTAVIGETGQEEFYSYIKSNFPDCEVASIMQSSSFYKNLQMCQQSKHGILDVALVGDSHAEYLFYGLSKMLPKKNVGYYVHWAKPYISNPNFNNIFNEIGGNNSPKTIILTMAYYGRLDKANNDLYRNFKEVISYLKGAGKNVILVGDAPRFTYEAENCKYQKGFIESAKSDCKLPISEALNQKELYGDTLQTLANEFNIDYIDIYPVLCDEKNCFMVKDGHLLYRDNNHISRYASILVAKFLIQNSAILRKVSND